MALRNIIDQSEHEQFEVGTGIMWTYVRVTEELIIPNARTLLEFAHTVPGSQVKMILMRRTGAISTTPVSRMLLINMSLSLSFCPAL